MTPVNKTTQEDKSLLPLATNFVWNIEWRLLILIFFIFLLVSSDVFIARVLPSINGTIDNVGNGCKQPSSFGTIIQGGILTALFVLSDIMVKNKLI